MCGFFLVGVYVSFFVLIYILFDLFGVLLLVGISFNQILNVPFLLYFNSFFGLSDLLYFCFLMANISITIL